MGLPSACIRDSLSLEHEMVGYPVIVSIPLFCGDKGIALFGGILFICTALIDEENMTSKTNDNGATV